MNALLIVNKKIILSFQKFSLQFDHEGNFRRHSLNAMQIRVKPLPSCSYCDLEHWVPVPAGEVSEAEDRPHVVVFFVWEDEDGRE